MHQLNARFTLRVTNIRYRARGVLRLFSRQSSRLKRHLIWINTRFLGETKTGAEEQTRRANIFCEVETATRPWLPSYKLFRVPIDQGESRLSAERAWISEAYWASDVSGALPICRSRESRRRKRGENVVCRFPGKTSGERGKSRRRDKEGERAVPVRRPLKNWSKPFYDRWSVSGLDAPNIVSP